MAVSGVGASPNSYQATVQSNVKQRQQDFQSLADALQAGNLPGAQHAFAALQQDRSSSPVLLGRQEHHRQGKAVLSVTMSKPCKVRCNPMIWLEHKRR